MNTMDENPEPGSRRPSGPEPGRGVPPGKGVPPAETPPGESSMTGAGPRETYNPAKGWSKGPLILIGAVVVLFSLSLLAMAVELWL